MTFAERNFIKSQSKKLNETRISSLTMRSEEVFFSQFYYSSKIATENVEVLSISALPIWSHIINNLITLFARALL